MSGRVLAGLLLASVLGWGCGSGGGSDALTLAALNGLFRPGPTETGHANPDGEVTLRVDGVLQTWGGTASFSATTEGATTIRYAELRNETSESVTMHSGHLQKSGTHAADFVVFVYTPWMEVPPGGAYFFELRFSPLGTGARAAGLTLLGRQLLLSGTGLAGTPPSPDITLWCKQPQPNSGGTDAVDGVVGQTTEVNCSISNIGTGTLTLGPAPLVTLSGTNADQFSLDTTGMTTSIGNGGYTTFKLRFQPTSVGTKIAQLEIPSNDPDEATFVLNLTGNGVAAPAPDIALVAGGGWKASGAAVDFAGTTTGGAIDQLMYVYNLGPGTLNLSGPPYATLSGADAGQFQLLLGSTSGSMAQNQHTTLTVRFEPTSTGTKTATLTITSNDPDEGTYTLNLTGRGVGTDPSLVLQGEGVLISNGGTFYTWVNQCGPTTFTVTNMGGSTLNLTGTPAVALAGVVDGIHSLTAAPGSTSIAMFGNTTFQITTCLTPFPIGGFFREEDVVITIPSNDPSAPSFSFTIISTFLC